MDNSDKKIVPEEVDFVEMPGGTGPDAANFRMKPDEVGGGNEGPGSSEQQVDTPTSRTRRFLSNLKQDTEMKINAGGTLFAGGLGVLAAAGGNLKLAAVEGLFAIGTAVRTAIRSGEVARENEKSEELQQIRAMREALLKEKNEQK